MNSNTFYNFVTIQTLKKGKTKNVKIYFKKAIFF